MLNSDECPVKAADLNGRPHRGGIGLSFATTVEIRCDDGFENIIKESEPAGINNVDGDCCIGSN